MLAFSAFWGGVRLALDLRIPTPVPLLRKLLSLSSLRNLVSYVQFLFKFSLYIKKQGMDKAHTLLLVCCVLSSERLHENIRSRDEGCP